MSLNFGFTDDLPVPIGIFDYGKTGTRTNIFSTFWEGLFHKNVFNKINVIAGTNYVEYRFGFTSYIDSLPSYSRYDKTVGLTLGGEYKFSKNSSVAALYKPSLFSFDKRQYRHLISLEARFDFNLWKSKSKLYER